MSFTPLTPRTQRTLSALELYNCRFPNECPPKEDLPEFASRLADVVLKRFVLPVDVEDPRRSLNARAKRIVVNAQPELLLIRQGKLAEGSHKSAFPGVLSSGKGALDVVVSTTKERKSACCIDWNVNELRFLQSSARTPVPGAVPVIAVKGIARNPGCVQQFSAIFPRYSADLYDLVSDQGTLNRLSPATIECIQEKLIRAVTQFHEGWIHRDIKPENILVQITPSTDIKLKGLSEKDPAVLNHPDTNIEVCLCDFAFTQKNGDEKPLRMQPGSPLYVPPEIADHCLENIRRKKENPPLEPIMINATQKGDVWSTGLILLALEDFSLFVECLPADPSKSETSLMQFLMGYREYFHSNSIPVFPEPQDATSKLHIIWEMLQPRPEKRPSMEEVLQKWDACNKEKK